MTTATLTMRGLLAATVEAGGETLWTGSGVRTKHGWRSGGKRQEVEAPVAAVVAVDTIRIYPIYGMQAVVAAEEAVVMVEGVTAPPEPITTAATNATHENFHARRTSDPF